MQTAFEFLERNGWSHNDGRGGVRCNLKWRPLPDVDDPRLSGGRYVPAVPRRWRFTDGQCDFPVEIDRRIGDRHAEVTAVFADNLHFACNRAVPLSSLAVID